MSDPVTPLGNVVADGPVRVEETGPLGMITLRGKLSDAAVSGALSSATGLSVPDQRQSVSDGTRSVMWMGPDETMIVLPRADVAAMVAALNEALGTAHALVVDVSDARATFRLTGEDAHLREVLARLIPVDMQRLAPGEVRRTRLAQVAAAVWMPAEGEANLICFRSIAQYTFDLLKTAAASPRVG